MHVHLDPRILEDVQRALKLKARREARLKAAQTTTPTKEVVVTSDQASGSSMSAYSAPARTKVTHAWEGNVRTLHSEKCWPISCRS